MERLAKSKLWIVVGAPASGKSTWIQYQESKGLSTNIISRDKIRFSLLGENDDYFSKEDEVWKLYVAAAKKSVTENLNTILDATHLNENSRRKILRAMGKSLQNVEVIAVYFNVPLEICVERNSRREGRACVPETALRNMYKSLTFPHFEEGFDLIYTIDQNGKTVSIKEREVI